VTSSRNTRCISSERTVFSFGAAFVIVVVAVVVGVGVVVAVVVVVVGGGGAADASPSDASDALEDISGVAALLARRLAFPSLCARSSSAQVLLTSLSAGQPRH
jgi:hypothetical protein